MSILPDEIWAQILEIGTQRGRLDHRDLCCLAIAGRRLNRLSLDPCLWATLLALDFPSSRTPEPPSKSLYRIKSERSKAQRAAAWRRAVLSAESRVAGSQRKLADLEAMIVRESEQLKAAAEEVKNLETARCASVALNVWQPEIVRGRQKQIVEQCTVPVETRLTSLRMELKVCKQQIAIFHKAHSNEKQKLREHREELAQLKYHPLQSTHAGPVANELNVKRKRSKRDCP